MKVLHLLDHSLPTQSGYSFRSDSILRALNARGVHTVQVTSPKHDGGDDYAGLRYSRSRHIAGTSAFAQMQCVVEARRALRTLAATERPDIVHAHSPCLNGLAALGLGVPVVYEMRSSWEDAAVSSGKTSEGSVRYRLSRLLETQTVARADAVVVICEGLRAELRSRGIPDQRIVVVGNAIDSKTLVAASSGAIEALRVRLGLVDHIALGFFGSFFAWEGLDLLLEALPSVITRVPAIRLVLAGGGEHETHLREIVRSKQLEAYVHFAGRVEHDEIPAYYGAIDLMVFPRHKLKITDMVTPLKPLEAMYLGAIVVASDVGGHRELIRDGETGYLFRPGNVDALGAAIVSTIEARPHWLEMRAHARRYVEHERTWDHMAGNYESLYRGLLGR